MIYLILIVFTFCNIPDIKYNFSEYLLKDQINKRKTMLIYPIKNTSSPQYSYYSEGITESIIHDLSMLRGIGVISQEDRKKALKELAYKQAMGLEESEVSKIAILTGADLFLMGSYSVESGQIRIIARVIDASSGVIIKSIKIDGLVKDIFTLQDNLTQTLLSTTGEPSNDDLAFLNNKPKHSDKAFETFSKGLEIEEANPKGALDYYKKSLTIIS